jgi:hypothetical protein
VCNLYPYLGIGKDRPCKPWRSQSDTSRKTGGMVNREPLKVVWRHLFTSRSSGRALVYAPPSFPQRFWAGIQKSSRNLRISGVTMQHGNAVDSSLLRKLNTPAGTGGFQNWIPAQKRCGNDDSIPGNVKLCESAGRAGGLPVNQALECRGIGSIRTAAQRPWEYDNRYSIFKEPEVANATIVNPGHE